jgi:hypothetical protein
VHDDNAIAKVQWEVIAAALEAGEPIKSLLLVFTKGADGWTSKRTLLSEADAVAFERDLAPHETALYAALRAQLTNGCVEATVTVLSDEPEPNLALCHDDEPVRTGAPEGDLKRAMEAVLRFFAERGRELARGSWTVRADDDEPQHDLFYA